VWGQKLPGLYLIYDYNQVQTGRLLFYLPFMKKTGIILFIVAGFILSVSFTRENLRAIYSRPSSQWPKPFVDAGVQWTELGVLPDSPIEKHKDSLKNLIELGKALFFDTRLSGSGKISCATCHKPEFNWTDGKEKSIGHEGAITKRNSPTIQNTWFYNRLFWDGRSRDLQDQAFAPINSETEMHSEMPDVMRKLRKIKGYKELFKKAFGDDDIDPFRMTEAIATFEKTIVSGKTRFDEFLEGKKRALSNSELRGLHLFRTRAKCMNCHSGSLFTDNKFHKSVFGADDTGFYIVSHKEEDEGKFKTPSLRDVVKTGPWGHNGSVNQLPNLLSIYNKSSPFPQGSQRQNLHLSKSELIDLAAFLQAISTEPVKFEKPILPE
jgi:cytochrome c peroxidase